jgi:hypothetical protein
MLSRDLMREIYRATVNNCFCQKREHNFMYHAQDCRVSLMLAEAEERLKTADQLADLVRQAVEAPEIAADAAFRERAVVALARNDAMIAFRAWGRRADDTDTRESPF